VTGAEMLKDIPYLVPAIPAVRYHHERWDGKGYPEGLAGVQIPLAARIVAVADGLDAMTTDRPYRMAMNANYAYKDLIDNSGRFYDPEVIKVFQSLWNEGKLTTLPM
jgi:HD-GYP domain-containing protein (c-di-GMP phosphodiesterase class II)